jgi:hypothetical protein
LPAATLDPAARRQAPDQRAWVAFCGRQGKGLCRLLAPSFRHCFVLLNDGGHWITVDPLSHRTVVTVQPIDPAADLPALYRRHGYLVVSAPLATPTRAAPWAPLTCVETVKRVLGLRAPMVWTPLQLYRRLVRLAAGEPCGGAQ